MRTAAVVLAVAVVGTAGPATARHVTEPADAGRSYAEGPGLLGGQQYQEGSFTIHAVAADGTLLASSGHPFAVSITQPEPTTARVKDNHDGSYSVTYTPGRHGTYVIAVTLGGSPIRDAPFALPVKPAPSAAESYAEGSGLGPSTAGGATTFTIHAVDEDGVPRADGGDSFPVAIHGPGGRVPTQTTDNADGTYTVAYTPPAAGVYTVKVTYGGKNLAGSPYHVPVGP